MHYPVYSILVKKKILTWQWYKKELLYFILSLMRYWSQYRIPVWPVCDIDLNIAYRSILIDISISINMDLYDTRAQTVRRLLFHILKAPRWRRLSSLALFRFFIYLTSFLNPASSCFISALFCWYNSFRYSLCFSYILNGTSLIIIFINTETVLELVLMIFKV